MRRVWLKQSSLLRQEDSRLPSARGNNPSNGFAHVSRKLKVLRLVRFDGPRLQRFLVIDIAAGLQAPSKFKGRRWSECALPYSPETSQRKSRCIALSWGIA